MSKNLDLLFDMLDGRAVWVDEIGRYELAKMYVNAHLPLNCSLVMEEQKSGYLVYIAKVIEQPIEIELLNGVTNFVQYSEIYKK